jgi:hypothetical protein
MAGIGACVGGPPVYWRLAVGPVKLLSHEGDRPISITWQVQAPLSAELFRRFSVLRG